MSLKDDSAHGKAPVDTKTFDEDVHVYGVPVDLEAKSKVLKVWSFQHPHHRSFHLSWISFFLAFCASFAAPPLIPVIRDNLDLTKQDISASSIASVSGAIFSRILMGTICDSFGPRYAHGTLQLLTSTVTFCIGAVTNAAGFIVCRMLIGMSLATFVATQFWCSTMFNARIVGTANAVSAGWGNSGGGAIQLIMPYIYKGIAQHHSNYVAWRLSFWIPAFAQIVIGLVVLFFGQDLPGGNYRELRQKGQKSKAKTHRELLSAVTNYRTWVMLLTYGYCFGVELTVDNNIANYIYDEFDVDLGLAGVLGAVFGLSNIFARPVGGLISDFAAKRFGMRGRLWALWFLESMGGVTSIMMFYTKDSLGLTMMVLVFYALFIPMACGATFGVVPFVTRRGLGAATGLIGCGGNVGSAITQAAFFTATSMTVAEGFKWMGVMVLGMTTLVFTLWWPMWGSMLFRGNPDYQEEDYYKSDYTAEEQERGLHREIAAWATESRSNRGFKAAMALDQSTQAAPQETRV